MGFHHWGARLLKGRICSPVRSFQRVARHRTRWFLHSQPGVPQTCCHCRALVVNREGGLSLHTRLPLGVVQYLAPLEDLAAA